ncbi:MAG TPA: ATP-binding protein [Bacteroidales bacterium]|jgi:serine/threonine-protein kinase RsbW|nr:ATP-binding protein [Bacteroidales bacterium]
MEKTLKIVSKIENLRKVEKLVDELSSDYNISADIYGNILIAALEAANNAILHGNKLDENKYVNISVRLDEHKLRIKIDDEGNGFDYKNVPDPTAPENIENVNGRGIFLMEKLSDKIEFTRNGASVELEFNIK